jgi:hypothetical protein
MNLGAALVLVMSACALSSPAAAREPAAVPAALTTANPAPEGEVATLEEVAALDRFGWPARFTCRRTPGERHPFSVVAATPKQMNERLLAARVWPADCHGGFLLRSLRPAPGKLARIVGEVVVEMGEDAGEGSGSSIAAAHGR